MLLLICAHIVSDLILGCLFLDKTDKDGFLSFGQEEKGMGEEAPSSIWYQILLSQNSS